MDGEYTTKIHCPHCNQKYEITTDLFDQKIECQNCSHAFIASPMMAQNDTRITLGANKRKSNLTKCPDCARDISRRANSCPHCGAPVEIDKTPQINVEISKTPVMLIITRIILLFIAFMLILGTIHYAAQGSELSFGFLIVAVILIGLFAITFQGGNKQHDIICPNINCKYRGHGAADGGSSGLLLVVLFLFGILPGLLYLLFAGKQGVKCPKCGMRVR